MFTLMIILWVNKLEIFNHNIYLFKKYCYLYSYFILNYGSDTYLNNELSLFVYP